MTRNLATMVVCVNSCYRLRFRLRTAIWHVNVFLTFCAFTGISPIAFSFRHFCRLPVISTTNVTGRHRGPKRKLWPGVACVAQFFANSVFAGIWRPW